MGNSTAKVLAGIDIGTLTCRLLIAEASPEEILTALHSDRKVLRLGEGCALSHRLNEAAISRVTEALRAWRQELQQYRVEGEVAVGTSAVRESVNQDEFLERIKAETGFDVEVITGEEEARRTMLGIRSGLPPSVEHVLGLDIGGGSTEFMLDRSGALSCVHSMKLGVVRLTEETLTADPPTAEQLSIARGAIRSCAGQMRTALGDLAGTTLVGTAGTITTLAAMAQELRVYEPGRIHNYVLTMDQLILLERDLLGRSCAQRRGMAGLEPGREDVILAGALILRQIMETLGFTSCLVSDLGLREGIVLDLATRLARGS